MTYPHNFVDSKVNNQLELNDVSRIMESNPQEQFQTFWDSQGSFNFQTDEESLQAFQVHSRRCRRCRPELGPKFISTQFKKKHGINPVESIAVQELGNNLLSCTSVLTSGCRMKLYYPLLACHTLLTPGEACSWALSRFKRDGLSNFQECTKNDLFSSTKETDLFRGCKFFHLLNMDNSVLSYEQIHPTEFSVLSDNLFRLEIISSSSVVEVEFTTWRASSIWWDINNSWVLSG
jgi:hypothetical protein